MRTRNYGSLFERVERIQTSIDKAERKTILRKRPAHAECIMKEFRL